MKIFDILSVLNSNITPQNSKIHLAGWNGRQDPLDVYLAGDFNKWQSWQSKKNFNRKFVVSLISMNGDCWLFAGVYEARSVRKVDDPHHFDYDLVEDKSCVGMNGRLVVSHARHARQSYRTGESCADKILVHEIRSSRLSVRQFPGFKSVLLTKGQLDQIVRDNHESWRTALSSIAGVYVITDGETGKLYVGSATGQGGIWSRWEAYSKTGHGGNAELRKLLATEGKGRAAAFRYSILEIADTHASSEDVLQREGHWKNVLLTRSHGLNAN